ncbi:MAG: TonB-dependent receptor [Woeseiaceae bacterium]|jgi:outer membrane receptor protein involved in Fe transport|nr:TonB-dependent receptor [Woeseiaceae bacterium]
MHTILFRNLSKRSVALAIMLSAAVNVDIAVAQEQTNADDALEEVIVTGSRLVRRDVETPAPIAVIGAEDVLLSGETDITQLLREAPALNGSLPATNSTQTGFDSDLNDDTGVGRLNLRNLGTNRTLVLVNGRRHVSAIQGSADVDVGSIPIALIERIETLTGGSSSVYGADAVTGVVNFILKEDFEGIDYRLQHTVSGDGDAGNSFAAITMGTNFDNDRGNITFSLEYTDQRSLNAIDRDFARNEGRLQLIQNSDALSAAYGRNPAADNVYVPDFRINFSSSSGIIALREAGQGGSVFGGLIDGDNDFGIIPGVPALQIFRNGVFREFDRGIEANPFEASGGDGIETVNPWELIVPEIKRTNANILGHYDIANGWELFTEVKYTRMETVDSDGIPFNDDIPIALDNAFIPAGLQSQIDAAIASGITPAITMSRDILDRAVVGTSLTDRDTFRAVGGIRKDFDNGLRFETSINYGRTDINTTERNSRVEDRFFAAVDAVVDPATGNVVCRSDIDPSVIPPSSPFPSSREGFLTFEAGDGQCRPINLFGTDSITSDAIGFAFIDAFARSKIEQTQFLATLAGDSSELFELPAGPLAFAVGYEYRDEKSSFAPPELERAGLLYNTANEARSIVSGEYDVNELFFETSIPLLSDLPLVQELTLDASYRFTDHSTAGDIDTYGTGLMWQPIDSLRFRGSYNRAVRAPNIFELFSPAQPSFLGVTADPCSVQNINAGTSFRESNCLQFVDAGFNSADFLSARIAGTTGGNPDLNPEEADTYTVGFIYQPGWLEGATLTVDYYKIEIADAIDSLTGARIAELCVDLPSIDNQYCDAIVRDPSRGNAIVDFSSGNVNLGGFETDGIDLAFNYVMELGNTGSALIHGLVGNYVLNNSDFPDPTDTDFELPQVGQLAIPEWILNYTLTWERDRLAIGGQARFQANQLNFGVTNEDIQENPLFADPLKTGTSVVGDLFARYEFSRNLILTGGINNVTDEEPFLDSLIRPVGPIGRTFFLSLQGTL